MILQLIMILNIKFNVYLFLQTVFGSIRLWFIVGTISKQITKVPLKALLYNEFYRTILGLGYT